MHRRIIADGQWITLTEKGVEELKKECYEYQAIFSTANIEVEIAGRLITGLGEGSITPHLRGTRSNSRPNWVSLLFLAP